MQVTLLTYNENLNIKFDVELEMAWLVGVLIATGIGWT